MHASQGTTPSSREYTAVVGTGIGRRRCSRSGKGARAHVPAGQSLVHTVDATVADVVETERAAERDDLPDELRPRSGQLAREDAAEAPADQADGPPPRRLQLLEARRSCPSMISGVGPRFRPRRQPWTS